MIVFSSSSAHLQDAILENNPGGGLVVALASTAQVQDSTIGGNGGDGINLSDTSVVQFDFPTSNNQITGNTGWGIDCQSSPAVAMTVGGAGTVTGNGAGQDNCPSG